MLEIMVVWRLAVHIGRIADQKGLKKTRYRIMAILFWIIGELLGGFLGSMILGGAGDRWMVYGMAVLGAIAGAGMAFLIMHFLPGPAPATENQSKAPAAKKFGRSIWVPVIAIVSAVSCLCVAMGGSVVFQLRDYYRQTEASSPIIGVETDGYGYIKHPVTEVSSKSEAIYFSFDYANPQNLLLPVTFDWYINGKLAYSFSRDLGDGQVVVALDRKELGMPAFNTGNYEVRACVGELFLTSASFVVK